MSYDVAIAGGGIGGTVLAHLLGRAGKKVVVVEKGLGPPKFVRPEGLWPVTAKLLGELLPHHDGAPASWLPLKGVRFIDSQRELVHVDADAFARAGTQLAMTDPNQTREELLKLPEFELRRGVEVTGVLKDGVRIAGVKTREVASGKETEIAAALTIGDDGVHSRVREGCGIELKTQILPVDLMTFGFNWPASLPQAVAHIWLNPARTRTGIFAMGAAPMPGGKGAALILVRPKKFDAFAEKETAFQEFLASDPRLRDVAGSVKFPQGVARIQRPWGHAASYGANGGILMGDAAHPVSPAGGQGANMAVADAVALADIILSGRADIVAEYERRRRPANARSIQFTRSVARAMSVPAFLADPVLPFLVRRVFARPARFERLIRDASSAFQTD